MKKLPLKSPLPVSSRAGVLPGAAGLPDRVWFSCNAKLNMGNYESMGCDVGMSSDVRPDERVQDAMDRITSFCIQELETKVLEIRASTAPKEGFKEGATKSRR